MRAAGTLAPEPLVSDDETHVSVTGLYRPPVLVGPLTPEPPQTIISDPVQTAVWPYRWLGTLAPEPLVRDDAAHESVEGLYRPPETVAEPVAPHTIISDPVQTAAWRDIAEGTFAPDPAVKLDDAHESVEGL